MGLTKKSFFTTDAEALRIKNRKIKDTIEK